MIFQILVQRVKIWLRNMHPCDSLYNCLSFHLLDPSTASWRFHGESFRRKKALHEFLMIFFPSKYFTTFNVFKWRYYVLMLHTENIIHLGSEFFDRKRAIVFFPLPTSPNFHIQFIFCFCLLFCNQIPQTLKIMNIFALVFIFYEAIHDRFWEQKKPPTQAEHLQLKII